MASTRQFQEVRSFHDFVTFYRRFIKHFSTLVAPITNYLKKVKCLWGPNQQASFELIMHKLAITPILALPNFELIFEAKTDASWPDIGVVLMQKGRVIVYFSQKLSEAKRK